MASTLTHLLYHCIWSTKERAPLISPEVEQSVWRVLSATAQHNCMMAVRVGGVENHVHALIHIPKTLSVADAMKLLKGGSSKYINRENILGPDRRLAWQDGYAAFTVSRSNEKDVVEYISNQREHHTKRTFEDEYTAFLDKHGIEYEREYLFD
ncbi:IS200/IS605 family transposase [Cerasicoccus frondis]|uniref:IS200/IS605 family transposase n=1 Tax=Cerasicoccus frondis TaxID=490090 RepID=UPI00285269F9|nr:IS200/IS605 family transposase [Cerasicoccus frondis]